MEAIFRVNIIITMQLGYILTHDNSLPEVFDLNFAVGTSFQYPLRPGACLLYERR